MTRMAQRGYALFLAAVVVAILAFVLMAVARVQGGLAPGLRSLSTRMQQDIVAESVASRVAFLLLTEPIGPRSVIIGGPREAGAAASSTMMASRMNRNRTSELRLDGRLYLADVAPGDLRAFVGVQDEAGLINLNSPDEVAIAGVLEQVGTQPQASGALAAILVDYVDGDDVTRASGAEASAYSRAGLSPPPNRAMPSRWDALNALGWRNALNGAQRMMLWRLVNAGDQQQMLNLNTAPLPVLEAYLGDRRAAASLAERRDAGELRDLQEIQALTVSRARAAGASLAVSPGTAFRLVITFGDSPARADVGVERRIVLAGPEAERPMYWREERRGRIGAGRRQDRDDATEPLPYSAAQPAS